MKRPFKKDDYIVLIGNPVTTDGKVLKPDITSYKIDHVYKQREDSEYLLTYKDSKGGLWNGWSCYYYKNNNWRFATEEEVLYYEKYYKPYDTNILKKIDNFSII